GAVAVAGGSLAFTLGTVVFLTYGRRRVTRRGVVFHKGRRTELIQQSRLPVSPTVSSPLSDAVSASLALESDAPPSPGPASSSRQVDVEESIAGRARAVVAMFGDERGPETLVEIGTALAGFGKLPVMHLTEVP